MMTYGTARQPLLDRGYIPLPVVLNGKAPAIKRWAADNYTPPAGFGPYNVGLICGQGEHPLIAVDIDVTDELFTFQLREQLLDRFGVTLYRVGRAPKVLLLYRAERPGIRKLRSIDFDCGHVEIMGYGQQIVAYGIHPDTQKPYTWPGMLSGPAEVEADQLPVIPEAMLKEIIADFEKAAIERGFKPVKKDAPAKVATADDFDPLDPLDEAKPLGWPIDKLKRALARLDPDCGRDEWRNIGFALHHETAGSPEAFIVWDEWSKGGTKYKEGEPEKQWESFGRGAGRPITARYLLKIIKDHGTKPPAAPADPSVIFRPTWSNKPAYIPPVITLNGSKILTPGNLGVVIAAPGTGKSAVCEALFAARLNANCDTFALSAETDRLVAYIDTERAADDHWRSWSRAMRRAGLQEGDEAGGHTFELIAMIADVEQRRTHLYSMVDTGAYGLLIIDGAADFVLDVNDPEECNAFSNELLARCKKHNCAVMVTIHSNPQPGAEKARGHLGSELMRRAESVLAIKRDADTGIRSLTMDFSCGKNRNDTDNLQTHFVWSDSAEMFVVSTQPPEGKKLTKEQKREKEERDTLNAVVRILQESSKPLGKRAVRLKAHEVGIGWRKADRAILDAIELEIVDVVELGDSRRSCDYHLTEYGKTYNLAVEGEI